jgi:hypothetical protein
VRIDSGYAYRHEISFRLARLKAYIAGIPNMPLSFHLVFIKACWKCAELYIGLLHLATSKLVPGKKILEKRQLEMLKTEERDMVRF